MRKIGFNSSNGLRLLGIVWIVAGIYIIAINERGALKSIEFQRSIGSPFSGRLSFWLFRVSGVLGGLIAIGFGILLLAGYS